MNTKLGDILTEIIDCEHKTAPEASTESYAFSVGTPHLREGRILYDQAKPISQETYEEWTKRGRPEAGDLILAREAPVGQVGLIGMNYKVALGQRTVLLKVNRDVCDSRYLHYKMLSDGMQRKMVDWSEGSTVQHLNVRDIPKLELGYLPEMLEQKRIAEILGSVDDKIEANSRLLDSLDELLRLEYVSSTSNRFALTISDIAVEVKDSISPGKINDDELYVGLEHLPRRNVWLREWGRGEDITSNKSRFKRGDILFGKLRPYFHKVVVAPADGICSTDIIVIRPKSGFEKLALQVLASDEVIAHATNASNGTRMPRTKWADLKALEIRGSVGSVDPNYSEYATSLIRENQSLTSIRDLLIRLLIG